MDSTGRYGQSEGGCGVHIGRRAVHTEHRFRARPVEGEGRWGCAHVRPRRDEGAAGRSRPESTGEEHWSGVCGDRTGDLVVITGHRPQAPLKWKSTRTCMLFQYNFFLFQFK